MPERLDIGSLFAMILSDPRSAFRVVVGLDLPRDVLWQGLFLLVALRVLAMAALGGSFVVPLGASDQAISPFAFATIMALNSVATVFLIHYSGKALNGTGTFRGAMIVTLLTDTLSVASLVVILALGLLAGGLAGLAGIIAAVAILLYTLVLIDENHGFGSLTKALGALVLGLLGVVLALSVLATLFGASLSGVGG